MDVSDDESPREDSPTGAKTSVTSDDVVAAMLEVLSLRAPSCSSYVTTDPSVEGGKVVGF